MELVGTIEKKFAVDGDTMKVILTMPASNENVDFINDVKGMRCNIYVQVREPESTPAKEPEDTTGNLFEQPAGGEDDGAEPPVEEGLDDGTMGSIDAPEPDEPEDEETDDDDSDDEAPVEDADATEGAPHEVRS